MIQYNVPNEDIEFSQTKAFISLGLFAICS